MLRGRVEIAVVGVTRLERDIAGRRVPEEHIAHSVRVGLDRRRRAQVGRVRVEQDELAGVGDDRVVRAAVADSADGGLRHPVRLRPTGPHVGADDVADAVRVARQDVGGIGLVCHVAPVVGDRRVRRGAVARPARARRRDEPGHALQRLRALALHVRELADDRAPVDVGGRRVVTRHQVGRDGLERHRLARARDVRLAAVAVAGLAVVGRRGHEGQALEGGIEAASAEHVNVDLLVPRGCRRCGGRGPGCLGRVGQREIGRVRRERDALAVAADRDVVGRAVGLRT